MAADVSRDGTSVSGDINLIGEAESEAVGPDLASADPELIRVIAAWPTLPVGVKARILGQVNAAKG